ncbi:MAG: DUF2384 domain-containing protein [Bacteroidia bacterium]|nr:DUF2384 domain-containing protein [Bacteroidia bacterium]
MIASVNDIFSDHQVSSASDLIAISRRGVQARRLSDVMEFTGMSNKELAAALPISERQLIRYAKDHLLKPEVTERLISITELYLFGYDLFQDHLSFQRWMRTSNIAAGDVVPITLLDTNHGIQMVRNILGRIQHGVHS